MAIIYRGYYNKSWYNKFSYMANPKTYFHDHLVLLLLTVNTFLAIFTAILVFLRLSSANGNSYIVQYRSILGVSAYKTGSVSDIISFGIFALLILAIGIFLSLRTYSINRHLAIMVLSFGILLTVLDIIISNALLVLR
jgi:hypothetical protein